MTTLSKKIFKKNNEQLHLQAFGKLPFYKDFISIVSDRESIVFREFLLNEFKVPLKPIENSTPFIFNATPKKLLVGMIENSTDGLREFPFSLMVSLNKNNCQLLKVWEELTFIRNELKKINDINECYQLLKGKTIQIDTEKEVVNQLIPDILDKELFICKDKQTWNWQLVHF